MIKKILKRFVKFIVCFAVIVGVLNTTNEPAKAVFVESSVAYAATQVIGTILVACGAYFASSDEAQSFASNVYHNLSNNDVETYEKINNIAAGLLSAGGNGTGMVLRLSDDLYNSISGFLDGLFSDDNKITDTLYAGTGPFIIEKNASSETDFNNNLPYLNSIYSFGVPALVQYSYNKSDYTLESTSYYYLDRCTTCHDYCYRFYYYLGSNPDPTTGWRTYDEHFKCSSLSELNYVISSGLFFRNFNWQVRSHGQGTFVKAHVYDVLGNKVYYYDLYDDAFTLARNGGTACFAPSYRYIGSTTYPGEDLVIQMPDIPDSLPDDGYVDLPPLVLNPQDIVGDIPEEKLQDIAFDVPLPADEVGSEIGTGTLPDVDVGEGEGDVTIPENPPIDTPTDDTGGILDILKDFFDSPSEFKLNFDAFKNIILLDRFPFCIPFDFIDSVKAFSIPSEDFNFSIDFDTSFLEVHYLVDLSPYQVPIKFFRATASVWFAVVLILKTRDLIKW